MELLLLAIVIVVLAIFAVESSVLGVDSRELSDDKHRPDYPVGIA